MYDVLEEIYDEYQDIFQFDSFHMGGDEVGLIRSYWSQSNKLVDLDFKYLSVCYRGEYCTYSGTNETQPWLNDWLDRSGVAIPGEGLTLFSYLSNRSIPFEKLKFTSGTEADSF